MIEDFVPPIDEKSLFDRLLHLETEKLTLAEDIRQLKKDASFDVDMNPKGIDKDRVKLIAKAAALAAKDVFDEKYVEAKEVYEILQEFLE